MFGFLGFLLIVFLLIVFIGFTILGNILRVLFGIGKRPPYRTSAHQKQNTYTRNQANDGNENVAASSASSSNKHAHPSGNRKKIFDDDEGEYVDYEEVK